MTHQSSVWCVLYSVHSLVWHPRGKNNRYKHVWFVICLVLPVSVGFCIICLKVSVICKHASVVHWKALLDLLFIFRMRLFCLIAPRDVTTVPLTSIWSDTILSYLTVSLKHIQPQVIIFFNVAFLMCFTCERYRISWSSMHLYSETIPQN